MNLFMSILHIAVRVVLIAVALVAILRSELSPAMKVFVLSTSAFFLYMLLGALSVMGDFLRMHVVNAIYLREIHRAVIGLPQSSRTDKFSLGSPVPEPDYLDPSLQVPKAGPDDPAYTYEAFLMTAFALAVTVLVLWSWWPEVSTAISHIR